MACQNYDPTESHDSGSFRNGNEIISSESVVTTDIGGGKSSCPPGWVQESPTKCVNYNDGKVCPSKYILTVFLSPDGEIETASCCPVGFKNASQSDCIPVTLGCRRSLKPTFVEQDGVIVVLCCQPGTDDCEGPGKTPRPRGR